MIHYGHDSILIPPLGILNRLDLAAHDNDLSSGHELATTISRSKVVRNTRRSHVTVQSLSKSGDKLVSLAGSESSWRARGKNEIAVEVNNKGIGGRSK